MLDLGEPSVDVGRAARVPRTRSSTQLVGGRDACEVRGAATDDTHVGETGAVPAGAMLMMIEP